ncbi:hypothetical protein SBBP1_210012 [Burkholderiales bacterium]|nr:hypothetical protein SBBP1_210012 [Burkholderiales bacterium]
MRADIGAAVRLARQRLKKDRARLHIGTRSLALYTRSGQQWAERDRQTIAGAGLEDACAAVRALLAAHRDIAIDVHLACRWTRLLLLPWIDQLTREERWSNYARARFDQVYGEGAQAWDIRVGRDLPGRDRIAAAWPVLLQAEFASQRQVRSARVGLLEHLGILIAQEPRFSGCLIELDSDGAGFLLLVDGQMRRVRWCRFDHDDGLVTAVRSEWATVLAGEATAPGDNVALALTPPALEPGSRRNCTVAALASGLGFRRAFSLPEWQ